MFTRRVNKNQWISNVLQGGELLKPLETTTDQSPFLKDLVDPSCSTPTRDSSSSNSRVLEWLDTCSSGLEGIVSFPLDSYLTHDPDELSAPGRLVASALDVAPQSEVDASSSLTCRPTTPGDRSLFENNLYREQNLDENGIFMVDYYTPYPEDVAALVNRVGQRRSSPGPTEEQVSNDRELRNLDQDGGEVDVAVYFRTKHDVFPIAFLDKRYKRSDKKTMKQSVVPRREGVRKESRIGTPVPNILYGYSAKAFTAAQRQQAEEGPAGSTGIYANDHNLAYPFFAIELKGDGPASKGSLWVATNQCLGDSAVCVRLAENLNGQLKSYEGLDLKPVNSAAFSVAMNGSLAKLFVSWKKSDIDEYCMKLVKSFAIQEVDQYIEFRKYMRNIVDWGHNERLEEIRDTLDALMWEKE